MPIDHRAGLLHSVGRPSLSHTRTFHQQCKSELSGLPAYSIWIDSSDSHSAGVPEIAFVLPEQLGAAGDENPISGLPLAALVGLA